jgi:simple sugar transport system permease protein
MNTAVLLLIGAIILSVVGTVLYMASYFWGGLLLILAVGLFIWRYQLLHGSEELRSLIKRWARNAAVPAAGLLTSVLIGAFLMLITGYNPIRAYRALFYGGLIKNWHVSVLNAAPLIFTALSVSFAFKAGLFNIGPEGQYYLGAMGAAWISVKLGLPPIISLPLIMVFSGLLGALWALGPAFLKVRMGAHEVITTMMLAHTARFLSPIFIRANGGDPASSSHPYVTTVINDNTMLPRFAGFLSNANYRLHVGILVAIVVALLVHYLLYKTSIGFEIRAVGQNKDAAKAQGISVARSTYLALLIAGFLAGLAGFNQVNGLDHRLFENLSAGFGWNGISVALLAGGNPIGVIFTSLLWGALDAGGQYMSRTTQTPNAIVEIVKGLILFLIVARYIYTLLFSKRKQKGVLALQEGTEDR